MNNRDCPVALVDAFAEKAKSVGTYTTPVAANLQQALKLVLDQARKTNPNAEQIKVAELLEMVDGLLDEYGGQTKASIASITAYKWRSKRILQDFIDYNDGDFMSWKVAIAKKSKGAAVKSAKKPKNAGKVEELPPPPPPPPPPTTPPGDKAHVIKLGGGKTGTLTLPEAITKKEIAAAWKQLDAYKVLLETIAGIEDPEGTETKD